MGTDDINPYPIVWFGGAPAGVTPTPEEAAYHARLKAASDRRFGNPTWDPPSPKVEPKPEPAPGEKREPRELWDIVQEQKRKGLSEHHAKLLEASNRKYGPQGGSR